jgi:hypothetical protein
MYTGGDYLEYVKKECNRIETASRTRVFVILVLLVGVFLWVIG